MGDKYRVVLMGIENSPAYFEREMTRRGVPRASVRRILTMAPVVIKKDLGVEEARRFAAAVRAAGGRVEVQAWENSRGHAEEDPELLGPPLSAFTVCSQCGLKQRAGGTCERCGNPLKKT